MDFYHCDFHENGSCFKHFDPQCDGIITYDNFIDRFMEEADFYDFDSSNHLFEIVLADDEGCAIDFVGYTNFICKALFDGKCNM